MAYINSSSVTGGTQHESNLHLYMHQVHTGPNQNQTAVNNENNVNSLTFGRLNILDWTISEGRDPGSKVVARAHGMQAQSGQNKPDFGRLNILEDLTLNIVFEDESFNGSTLVVHGFMSTRGPSNALFEWAIVGGTGQFTLAQGIVSGVRTNNAYGSIYELSIHVFYRTIQRINNALE